MWLYLNIRKTCINGFTTIVFGFLGLQSLAAQTIINDTNNTSLEDTLREVYFKVEEMPKFNQTGDLNDFRFYLLQNLQFPDSIAECLITTFYLSFIIEPSGETSNIEIIMRGSEYCDTTVARYYERTFMDVMKKAPKFEPGKQRGKPVPVQVTFPLRVHFQ